MSFSIPPVQPAPSTTAVALAASSSSAFDALDNGSDPATSAKAAITSPGTIKIVVLLVVTTIVLFGAILFVLCCYRDGDRRSRFCGCFGRRKLRSLPPRLPPKDGYGHDDTQPLTLQAESLAGANPIKGGPDRQEARSWTDRIRHSMLMDRPGRSYISPPRSPVMMTSIGAASTQQNTMHRVPTRPSVSRHTALPPTPQIQPLAPNAFRSPVRRDFGQSPPTPPKPSQPRMLAPPVIARKQAPQMNVQQSSGPFFDEILQPPRVVREPRSLKRQGAPRDPGTPLRFADEGYAASRVE